MKFAVLNTTNGNIVNTYDNPNDCLKEVEQQNLQNPEQIYTMVNI